MIPADLLGLDRSHLVTWGTGMKCRVQIVFCPCGFKGLLITHHDQLIAVCPICGMFKPVPRWSDRWN